MKLFQDNSRITVDRSDYLDSETEQLDQELVKIIKSIGWITDWGRSM